MYWVLSMPYWMAMAITVVGFVLIACVAHAIVRRLVPYTDLTAHNDVAGFMISVVGVLYAVMLAFIVIIVWQEYDNSASRVQDEVSAIAEIYNTAHVDPGPNAAQVQALADQYTVLAIEKEWPAMRRGESSPELLRTLSRLEETIVDTPANTPERTFLRNRAIAAVERVIDDRRHRLADNANGLPPILWAVLWVGGTITIGFGFLFGVEKSRVQLLMTGAVATLVAISFVVIAELDYPYRGDTGVSSGGWVALHNGITSEGQAK